MVNNPENDWDTINALTIQFFYVPSPHLLNSPQQTWTKSSRKMSTWIDARYSLLTATPDPDTKCIRRIR